MSEQIISTAEAAKILGVSRVAVFKRIKSGQLKAKKVGHNFVIDRADLHEALGVTLGDGGRRLIEGSVKKVVKEYGEALKLLGQE